MKEMTTQIHVHIFHIIYQHACTIPTTPSMKG